ncbi:MAG: aldehyde dehydrogenase family protein, partial [Candidatus Binataceae bacterium]
MAESFDCKLFIDGKLVDSSDRYDLIYPYTLGKIGSAARAGEGEMEAAISSASRAFQKTRRLTRAQRAELL